MMGIERMMVMMMLLMDQSEVLVVCFYVGREVGGENKTMALWKYNEQR